ncbi:MAG: 50S ribosomal protein L9 [Verrucomicrobiales bacterium]|nr:50S ribosomal protein L9 [Verrucomicrobiales bacterium]|tara:strand:- start:26117 stop:26635 length:519 start_codon:yes stop_codon:yes gene_type:complete
MAKTDIILLKPVEHLGAESDQVSVAAGYARNYLIPEGLAIPVTAANKRRLDALAKRREKREADELQHAKDLDGSFKALQLYINVRTGDDGKLFGAVTNSQIAEELKKQFDIELDRRKIHLPEPIKIMGDYTVEMNLHAEVHSKLKVSVKSTNPNAKLPEKKKEEEPREEKKD